MLGASLAVGFMKIIAYLYDVLTLPIQIVLQKAWKKWKTPGPWAKKVDDDPYSHYVLIDPPPSVIPEDIQTLAQLFQYVACNHRGKEVFGIREVLDCEQETQKDGKTFRKLLLGDYKWRTIDEANEIIGRYSRSLLSLGLKSRDKVALFAETRYEWMLIAQACFRINVGVVTLYPTLGDDGLIHGINEAHVSFVITSEILLPKIKKIIQELNAISHLLCMGRQESLDSTGFPDSLTLISFSQLENLVDDLDPERSYEAPSPDDLAILMYTSGSTGVPKGVMITHKNIVSAINGFCCVVLPLLQPEEMYIAYLPIAHIFELAAELVALVFGYRIGYSSPLTLTDKSTGLVNGCKGDTTVLQPTIMAAVPLMLDRIRKSLMEEVEAKGVFSKSFFQFALKYKKFWSRKGFETPILNRIVFKKMRNIVGGRLGKIICGSAPLSADTQEFIKLCLDLILIQGYGATEVGGAATAMKHDDPSTGTVGPPTVASLIRFVDWPEGNYYVTDEPNPRGEVVLGGDCITAGYYLKETLTNECYTEENGIRWFYTGDIGEMLPNGSLKIIDRKKDLMKLQDGEYISLGKVESELKTSFIVDNICVSGNSFHNYTVALVVPNEHQLRNIAKEIGKDELSFVQLCQDEEVTAAVTMLLINHGKECHLSKSEIPQKISLCSEEWSPDNGLLTAAFKLRRKPVEQYYRNILEGLYDKQPSTL